MPLKSFIEVSFDSHFPLENLPFGVFKTPGGKARAGVALGEYVVDLSILQEAGHFPDLPDRQLFARDALNDFLSFGGPPWRSVRKVLQNLLSAATPTFRAAKTLPDRVFHTQSRSSRHLPRQSG